MRRTSSAFLRTAALLCLVGVLPFVLAHGEDDHGAAQGMDMDMNAKGSAGGHGSAAVEPEDEATALLHAMENYFRHPHYSGWNLAHALLMILAWCLAMPVALFLSSARSRFHLPAQVFFHLCNGLGVFTGFVYNHATPDLYVNNAHHPLGWVVTAFTIAWTLMSFYVAYGEYAAGGTRKSSSHRSVPSASSSTFADYHHLNHQYDDDEPYARRSRDSGQGTERNSASLFGSRQGSSDSVYQKPEVDEADPAHDDIDLDEPDRGVVPSPETRGFLGNNRVDRFVSRHVLRFSAPRAFRAVRFSQLFLEKVLLLLGFAALTTGFVVSGGIFRGGEIFSGLAHYIKGGIFVFYGFLTLGRWMGAFAEFGWAWNLRPAHPSVARWKSKIPSAEFTESFVIWLYGASNVFLEHLSNWGQAWSPTDIEHVSITVLFFGGGLLGMLIESRWARELMNTSVLVQKSSEEEAGRAGGSRFAVAAGAGADVEESGRRWEQPQTYRVPLNPMPALTITLLGMMMGAHHQHSMVSTMMHAQWGGLFTAFALARGATYITLWLKPPTSHFPSRPPSEIVAAFCLTSGGFLFMNSASDTVWAIESNGLDAMTIFTLSMGLTGVVLAWEVVNFAIKGWAIRKERTAAGKPVS